MQALRDLPLDELETILAKLSSAECWRTRLVCKRWNAVARKLVSYEAVHTLTSSNSLVHNVTTVCEAHLSAGGRVRNSRLKLCILEEITLDRLVSLLQSLDGQVLQPALHSVVLAAFVLQFIM